MRDLFIISLFTITCAVSTSAQVIQYEIDPSFNSGLLFNRGSVSDIVATSNANYFIMGMFSGVDSPITDGSQINSDGTLYDATNVAGTYAHEYKDGFLRYGNGIRRFRSAPGQINVDFNFEFQKSAYNGGFSNIAKDALITPDDNILVTGRFFTDSTLIGTNIASQGLRQLCMVDSTGAPVPGFPMLRCEWPTNAVINTIHQLSTGEYIIAGSFNEVGGYSFAKLAKLNADFSVNTDFEPVFESGSGEVFVNLVDSQDRVWIAFQSSLSLISAPNYLSAIARILPSGSIDTLFNAPVCTAFLSGNYENPSTPLNVSTRVTEDEDGSFILWGDFIKVNGEDHRRLAKIDDAGNVIAGAFENATPDSAVWGSFQNPFGPVMSASIRVVEKLPDGKLLLGGRFSSFGGEPYSCLVRLQPNGFVGVDDKEGRGKLKIWPNPTNGIIRVALPEENERIERVEIADLQGRVVKVYSGNEVSNGLEISGLNAGIYLVRAWSETGVYTQKLILE